MPSDTQTADGLRWLEALARRYEEYAAQVREAMAMIQQAERLARAQEAAPETGNGAVPLREAVRIVLGTVGAPLTTAKIWEIIQERRMRVITRSANPENALQSTIWSMEESRQIKRVGGTGRRGSPITWSLS